MFGFLFLVQKAIVLFQKLKVIMETCQWNNTLHNTWDDITFRINTYMSLPYIRFTAVNKDKQHYGSLKYNLRKMCIKERLAASHLLYEVLEHYMQPFTHSFICKPLLSDTALWKPILGSATLATLINFSIIATFMFIRFCLQRRRTQLKRENDRRIKEATKKRIKQYKQKQNKQEENSDTIHGLL